MSAHVPAVVQPPKRARLRDIRRRAERDLEDSGNRDAAVWADSIVLQVMHALDVPLEDRWAQRRGVHELLFGDLGWPAMRALREAWTARVTPFSEHDLLGDLSRRARLAVRLGWAPPGMTRADLHALAASYHQGGRAGNQMRGWVKRLERGDRRLRVLEHRIRELGVGIYWEHHERPRFHWLP
jgi:hypothetical protein